MDETCVVDRLLQWRNRMHLSKFSFVTVLGLAAENMFVELVSCSCARGICFTATEAVMPALCLHMARGLLSSESRDLFLFWYYSRDLLPHQDFRFHASTQGIWESLISNVALGIREFASSLGYSLPCFHSGHLGTPCIERCSGYLLPL